jgi:hypothetical protein
VVTPESDLDEFRTAPRASDDRQARSANDLRPDPDAVVFDGG